MFLSCLWRPLFRLVSRVKYISVALLLMNFCEISRETITTMQAQMNDYILDEIETGTREQDTKENSNRHQSV